VIDYVPICPACVSKTTKEIVPFVGPSLDPVVCNECNTQVYTGVERKWALGRPGYYCARGHIGIVQDGWLDCPLCGQKLYAVERDERRRDHPMMEALSRTSLIDYAYKIAGLHYGCVCPETTCPVHPSREAPR